MMDAGQAVLPELSATAFLIAPGILAALQADPTTWANFQAFPASYQRIRVGFVKEMRRRPEVFATRLGHLLKKTHANKQFGGIR